MTANTNDNTDKEVWLRYAAGADQALTELVKKYNNRLIGFLTARKCADPESTCQELWRKVIENRGSFDGNSFSGWFFKIARNMLYEQFRKAERRNESNLSPDYDPASQTMATNQSHRVSGSAAGKGKQKMILGVLATLAAAVLVMFSIGQFGGSGSSVAKAEWRFTKSGLLESDISEAEMLDQLAAASAAWYNKTPTTPAGLAKRLRQFDLGCEALLSSRLTQLSPSNRSAVHAACEDCREAIARQLVAIANGGKLAQIQSASDTAIDALTRSIKRLS